MERRLASLRAEVSVPERNKFTAPLLLLHGLWSGSWMWREVAEAFAQRGWEGWELDLRGHSGDQPQPTLGKRHLNDDIADLIAAAQALWAPPIICGHDFGALLALLAAPRINPRALVCLAPLLPRAWNPDERPPLPLARLSAVPALLWSWPLSPPRAQVASEFLFTTLPPQIQTQLHTQLQPDSGTIVRTLLREEIPFPSAGSLYPTLVISGSADRMSSPAATRQLATRLQAEHRIYADQGHWFFTGKHATTLVTDVHRWLIQTLGEAVLTEENEDNEEL